MFCIIIFVLEFVTLKDIFSVNSMLKPLKNENLKNANEHHRVRNYVIFYEFSGFLSSNRPILDNFIDLFNLFNFKCKSSSEELKHSMDFTLFSIYANRNALNSPLVQLKINFENDYI